MVSIVILNYNGEKFLKSCLESVLALAYADKEIIFLDNASSDGSVAFVLKHFPRVRVVANTTNSGYAGGANQAVHISYGDFILIMNPDIIFEPEYLSVLMKRMKRDAGTAAIIGKVRQYDFTHDKKTKIIDSAGLSMSRSRRCVDRGQGEEDKGQYDTAEEVFGITGACPLYRRLALEEIKLKNPHAVGGFEYFDEDFFMYKEDVDISWRLQLAGFDCFYEPAAMAYHGRATGVLFRGGAFDVAKNRKELSKFQKYLSYKNERLMRVKNDSGALIARDFFPIAWKEMLMTGWMIFREPFLFKSLGRFLLQLPKALKKRREIIKGKKVSAARMKKWFR